MDTLEPEERFAVQWTPLIQTPELQTPLIQTPELQTPL